jgi:hypothetical protein
MVIQNEEKRDRDVRLAMGFKYEPDEFPVVFWDLFGEQGHPPGLTSTCRPRAR